MKNILLLSYLLTGSFQALAQEDSVQIKELDQVVITATKRERAVGSLPMPVAVIDKSQIAKMGALRLNDVLAEQTGLTLVYDHGTGVQMQGFSPEYTLILLDGEPLIGRTAGTLDLTRLAVGSIKQIEIVKGPSSSLYGSEALAGVINIITDQSAKTSGKVSARMGSFQTSNLSGELNLVSKNVGLNLFGNRYASKGYDLSPNTLGQTVAPFKTYTFQPRFYVNFSEKTKLKVSARYYTEHQEDELNVGGESEEIRIDSRGEVTDYSVNPVLTQQLSDKVKLTGRFYFSKYSTDARQTYQADNAVFDESFFDQTFARPELQGDFILSQKSMLLAGTGLIKESVKATRYDDLKRFETKYAFVQFEHFLSDQFHFNVGARYDAHSVYRNQLSPKVAALYQPAKNWQIKGSFGYGYKAPDFRQLFLNFSNAVAGYSVFGSEELAKNLEVLQTNNQLQQLLVDINQFGNIRPESSQSLNIGFSHDFEKGIKVSSNVFRNDIKDLIETFPVATKTNRQFVYSYRNLNAVFTQGLELNASKKVKWNTNHSFDVSVGYQYLEAKDKAVLSKIKEGTLYRRNPQTLETERVSKKEYGGLVSRSKHNANLRLFYSSKQGYNGSFRVIYRSKYGFGDLNGNSIIDTEKEYIKGFFLLNMAAAKEWSHIKLQLGVDNLLNYTNANHQPGLGGRKFFANVAFSF